MHLKLAQFDQFAFFAVIGSELENIVSAGATELKAGGLIDVSCAYEPNNNIACIQTGCTNPDSLCLGTSNIGCGGSNVACRQENYTC